jgi:hypothetical protein
MTIEQPRPRVTPPPPSSPREHLPPQSGGHPPRHGGGYPVPPGFLYLRCDFKRQTSAVLSTVYLPTC